MDGGEGLELLLELESNSWIMGASGLVGSAPLACASACGVVDPRPFARGGQVKAAVMGLGFCPQWINQERRWRRHAPGMAVAAMGVTCILERPEVAAVMAALIWVLMAD